MIKYLKNLTSSCPPQIEEVPVRTVNVIKKGSVCQYDDEGYVDKINTDDYATKFLILDDKNENDGKDKVRAIRLLPGMVIEAPIYEDPDVPMPVFVGNSASFYSDDSNNYVKINVGSGSLSICSLLNSNKTAICVIKNA